MTGNDIIIRRRTWDMVNRRNIMKKSIQLTAAAVLTAVLCSCGIHTAGNSDDKVITSESAVNFDPSAPEINFTAQTHDENGKPMYYLFDDNPEHLNDRFLADGAIPSSIAHFEDLTPGIYTVFSYHHRGYSVDFQANLYYDAAFSTDSGGSFKILALGIDKNWDWNQAWADYTGTSVQMPMFMRTFNCTCGDTCTCMTENGTCIDQNCPAIIRGESRQPKTHLFTSLNRETPVSAGSPLFLSDIERRLTAEDINHFRYGGYNEPMWMMLRFEVVSGTVTFDTLAYQNKYAARANFSTLKKGPFDNEPQYKGIANNAPIVTAEFDYTITDETPAGPVPVTVRNMRVPNGYTIPDGTFATNVNIWREEEPIAAQSDLMILEYRDDTKLGLYGENVTNKDNIWRFDASHTKTYSDTYTASDKELIEGYGVMTGGDFVPNSEMSALNYPTGSEISTDDFYRLTACNLGNFGVTSRYVIHLKNEGSTARKFKFDMSSIAGQVYRFSQTASDGTVVYDDGGSYYMKNFDDDPAEDPASTSEPKARLKAAEYSDTLTFDAAPGSEYDITIEITTLTGCTAPMHNTMSVE